MIRLGTRFWSKSTYKAGATVMGCRDFLIAYNINLNSRDARMATDIAFELREAGREAKEYQIHYQRMY